MAQRRVVVVGGGNSAGYLVRAGLAHHRRRHHHRVTIVSEENVLPYERPALSKAFLNEHSPARLPGFHTCVGGGGERQTEEWYKEKEVETKVSEPRSRSAITRRNGWKPRAEK